MPADRVPIAFLVLQKFHLCFHNSTETRYMFFYFLNIYCLVHLACHKTEAKLILNRNKTIWMYILNHFKESILHVSQFRLNAEERLQKSVIAKSGTRQIWEITVTP